MSPFLLRQGEEWYYRCQGCQAAFDAQDDVLDPGPCLICGDKLLLAIRRIRRRRKTP